MNFHNRPLQMNTRNNRPLSNDDIRKFAPSIFATEAHHSRSGRYSYIPTVNVIDGLRNEGFVPFFATQTRCRNLDKREYTKHMLRLRHAKDMERFLQVGEDIPEIVLINSHDGSSSYQLMAGLFRLVCANGMVVGNCSHDVRIKHSGNAVGEVIEGAYSIIENFGDMARDVDGMKLISLQPQEQKAFGKAALELKYPTTEDGKETSPITVEAVLEPRRYEDNKSDLWTTFSRIQENMIRGGVQGRASTGRRLTTRAVSGINQNVSLNRALWTLAKEMEALKTS